MKRTPVKRKGETKLEKETRKKREMSEDLDYLRQVENRGGKKFVIDEIEEGRKKEQDAEDQVKTYLQGKGAFSYRKTLANHALNKIHNLDLGDKWEYDVIPTSGEDITVYGKRFKTKPGVVAILKADRNVYIRAILTSYDPDYDFNAMNLLVTQFENTIDSIKGLLLSDNIDTPSTLKRTKSGIYLE